MEQKTKLRENKEKKLYYVFLQGTPRCGLHYLIMQQHQGVSPKPIKASQIVLGEVERDIWEQIVFMLDLSIDVKSTQKDIPATIATLIELRLKEKPIVMVIFNVEDWGESYLYNLKKLISYLNKILIEGSKNSLYWYFLHTGAPELGEDEDLIVLPWVTEIAKEEVKNIFLSHESHFGSCEADIYPLFQVPKKLSDVIDIFLEHSSCKDELMQHFNKLQLT